MPASAASQPVRKRVRARGQEVASVALCSTNMLKATAKMSFCLVQRLQGCRVAGQSRSTAWSVPVSNKLLRPQLLVAPWT